MVNYGGIDTREGEERGVVYIEVRNYYYYYFFNLWGLKRRMCVFVILLDGRESWNYASIDWCIFFCILK